MPSEGRTTGTININGQIGTNTSILNGKMQSRLRISPADIDLIKDTYNLFIQHTHQMYDQEFLAFANTAPKASEDRTTTSTVPYQSAPRSYTVAFDKDDHEQMATDIFDLILYFNSYVYQHLHEWQDSST